jgi:O-antigen ligase
MSSTSRPETGRSGSQAMLALAILLVALAASALFSDPFTSAKWYVLEALAAAWLVAERFANGGRELPSFLRRHGALVAVLVVLSVLNALRHGAGLAVEPLIARVSLAAIVLSACSCFRRTQLRLDALRGSVALGAAVVVAVGLAQMAGVNPLSWLTAGDQRSATFGNVNMAAQFVGLAVVFALASPPAAGLVRLGRELSIAAGLAYVALAGTRSVALALVAALLVLAVVRRLSLALALRTVALALLLGALVLAAAPTRPPAFAAGASKQVSARMRLAVWTDTLALIRDHPFGVGAGGFERAFMPYALGGRSRPGERLVFLSPHNELLRLVAEEGLPGAALALALLYLLARELHRRGGPGWWRSDIGALLASVGAFLAVESMFQFPFALAAPSLLACLLLGLALAVLEPVPGAVEPTPSRRGRVAARAGDAVCLLVAVAIAVGLARTAAADYLFANRRGDREALERACALEPRRLDACVEAAWRSSRDGDHDGAEARLREVLAVSPAYLPAIKLLAEDLFEAGRLEDACREARVYDALLGGRGAWRVPEACAGAAAQR